MFNRCGARSPEVLPEGPAAAEQPRDLLYRVGTLSTIPRADRPASPAPHQVRNENKTDFYRCKLVEI